MPLRILDANFNRAREAARVLDDYCRFRLSSSALAGSFKEVRHALTRLSNETEKAAGSKLSGYRDSARDVGPTLEIDGRAERGGVSDVVAASFKRLEESLRALEEFSKPVAPAVSPELEKLRYETYELERVVMMRAAPSRLREKLDTARLMVIADPSAVEAETLAGIVSAGAGVVQLRSKGAKDADFSRICAKVVEALRTTEAIVIVNDRTDIAVSSGADGVHVGAGDLTIPDARKVVGPDMLVGSTARSAGAAEAVEAAGADYIGFGAMFPSGTKKDTVVVGPEALEALAGRVGVPVFPIAGITLGNVALIVEKGVRRAAVSGAIIDAPDPVSAVRALSKALAGGEASEDKDPKGR